MTIHKILEWTGFAICIIAVMVGALIRRNATEEVYIDILLLILGGLIALIGVIFRIKKSEGRQ